MKLYALRYLILFSICMLFCCSDKGITLSIDPAKSSSLQYVLGVDIYGKIRYADTLEEITSSLRTFLHGIDSPDKKRITMNVSETHVTANFLDNAQQENLEQQFEKMILVYMPQDGELVADESQSIPVVDVQGWDMYRNFVKVFPVFPSKPVRQGDTWERERVFPIVSNYGDATGHIYQNFSLDSVKLFDSEHHLAYISWQYSYQVELSEKADSSYLSKMPRQGKGNASAVLNLASGIVETAHADFEVDADSVNTKAISWRQTIHLELLL